MTNIHGEGGQLYSKMDEHVRFRKESAELCDKYLGRVGDEIDEVS